MTYKKIYNITDYTVLFTPNIEFALVWRTKFVALHIILHALHGDLTDNLILLGGGDERDEFNGKFIRILLQEFLVAGVSHPEKDLKCGLRKLVSKDIEVNGNLRNCAIDMVPDAAFEANELKIGVSTLLLMFALPLLLNGLLRRNILQ